MAMKQLLLFCFLPSAAIAALEMSLADATGHPLAAATGVEMALSRSTDALGIETIVCRIRKTSPGTNLVLAIAQDRVPGATTIWDGREDVPVAKAPLERQLLLDNRFLFGGAHDEKRGIAVGIGAEDGVSFADFRCMPAQGGLVVSIAVHAALIGSGEHIYRFHRIPYSPKYGMRDAFARYYMLYPARFKRDPRVNPAAYGIGAQYASWTYPNPERCRFSGATWEWCHAADRSWGDPLNLEPPTGKPRTDYTWVEQSSYRLLDGRNMCITNAALSVAEFDEMLDSRFASAYPCGVINAFYMMVLSKISNKIAARHPDSLAGANSFASPDYTYATDVFTFPQCSWGAELRRQLARLVKKHDFGAIAFDVSSPRPVYRGARLAEMQNVGWDKFGPGVVRGVGTGLLCEFVRTLPNRNLPGNCAALVNSGGGHISDMLYADTLMTEATPWDKAPPFPLAERLALGEKGLTFWEGFMPTDFDPNFTRWAKEDRDLLINDLSRYAVWRSFAVGASLPSHFMCEYTFLASRAFARMNDAGFKPVPGFTASGEGWDTARYGLGETSFLAVCNLLRKTRKVQLEVFPDEIRTGIVEAGASSGGYLYAPFFGGVAKNAFSGGKETVEMELGPQLAGVLEAVGKVEGAGTLEVAWEGDFDEVRLVLRSKDFRGEFMPRIAFETYRREGTGGIGVSPGDTLRIAFRNTVLPGMAAKIRTFGFPPVGKDGNPTKPSFPVRHAADADSAGMALAVARFFASARTMQDSSLPPHTLCIEDGQGGKLEVSAEDRWEFQRLVRRFLDAVNALCYTSYAPDVKMPREDRARYPFIRW